MNPGFIKKKKRQIQIYMEGGEMNKLHLFQDTH